MISLREVSKTYEAGAPAVDRLSLEVAPGETVVLLGASGCGKTTTLKMINRLVEPSAGEIHVDGQNTADADPVTLRRIVKGSSFQDHELAAQRAKAAGRRGPECKASSSACAQLAENSRMADEK